MGNSQTDSRHKMMIEALGQLEAAIDLLDRAAAPGHIAAHVDLALHELERAIGTAIGAPLKRSDASDEGCGTVRTS